MSLWIGLICECCGRTAYDDNITHNLGEMAKEAGVYSAIWTPEKIGITHAKDLIPKLEIGIGILENDRAACEKFNPENGWGDYYGLVKFVQKYLAACKKYPETKIKISR